ncbi:Swp82p [Nakaseomyces bracarensis]|uniref:Swp82p n=1 Tax=Nakaseomyces bracarensis TaxID=273131 RepID=UPI00387211DA
MSGRHNSRDSVIPVGEALLKEHERVILKRTSHILREEELLQGPLNEIPRKNIDIPSFCGDERQLDETGYAYKMIQQDPQGEKKIRADGVLIGGRHYLFNIFTLKSRYPLYFVLISDLIETLFDDVSLDDENFLESNKELVPLTATEEEEDFLESAGLLKKPMKNTHSVRFVTVRSAFIQYGASIIASGQRVTDDYWETVAKAQGFSSHHRVFKLTKKQLKYIKLLNPLMGKGKKREMQDTENVRSQSQSIWQQSELPYTVVMEHPQDEIKEDYIRQNELGEQAAPLIIGQNITGSLELSAQFKVPRYHSKNSFMQATQLNALDIPIGEHESLTQNLDSSEPNGDGSSSPHGNSSVLVSGQSPAPSVPTNKPIRRMLSSILDNSVNSIKMKKSEEHEVLSSSVEPPVLNTSLNLGGWKFESLPLKSFLDSSTTMSPRGLPYYDGAKLKKRLSMLTPNEIKELEHFHDTVVFNTGLQKVRKVRNQRWAKYWQYKSGLPIGIRENQVEKYVNQDLKDVLEQTSVKTVFNEMTNMDEVHTTKRIANANFLGSSNMKRLHLPYMEPPNGKNNADNK